MKKWLNWIVLVLVFSIACGFLSNWQFARRETKLAAITLVKTNYSLSPVSLEKLLIDGQLPLPEKSWRRVRVSGKYIPEKTLLVRNRPNDGQAGFEELVPFISDNGTLIYVSRGWIPSGSKQDYPDSVPLPSADQTTLIAHLMVEEPVLNRSAPKGQLATINIGLANQKTSLASSFDNGYLRMISESPRVGGHLKHMPAPATEEGNNLSYALQWILFALMAAIALIWRIRKDSENEVFGKSSRRQRRSELDAQYEDETTTVR